MVGGRQQVHSYPIHVAAPEGGTLPHAALYEIWWSRGHGTHTGPRFRTLEDALKYVHDNRGRASFSIRKPDDVWYRREPLAL